MQRRDAKLLLIVAAGVGLALLTAFGIELSNTQAMSRQDVEARVHERAVLAAALIDGLFQSVVQEIPQDAKTYGGRTVSGRALERHSMGDAYAAVLGSTGGVLAATPSFDAEARSGLASSGALGLIRSGAPYGLGNLTPYGRAGALDFAVAFPTAYGTRTLVMGFAPSVLSDFLATDLRKIPGVRGAQNYVLDGHDAVLASTNPAARPGLNLSEPQQLAVLSYSSGEANGQYYDQVPLQHSTWRVVLAAPDGPLFASVSGLSKWVPWAIFAALAIVGLVALVLGRRVLVAHDEVHEANARLAELNEQLGVTNAALERRADELARSNGELDTFASIASHDLQEPLRKIRGFTDELRASESGRLSDAGRHYLARTSAAAERMQNLIIDLLRFSRVATHGRPFAPVDLAIVTTEVLGDLEAQVERTDAIVQVGRLPTISADALQVRQLMQNLISNALKFRRPGVRPEVTIASERIGDQVRVMVADNGIGFEPESAARIFRPFERLHGRAEYPGTGIGLALCQKIVERHGGTISACSELGAGSTFTVTLPLRQAEEVTVPSELLGHDGASAGGDKQADLTRT